MKKKKQNSKQTKAHSRMPIEISYRQLWEPEFLKTSYLLLKSKPGKMTTGYDAERLDEISNKWVSDTIYKLKNRSFKFKPVRITYIPKANGKMRPLGIPNPKDKIIQQALKRILEAKFEKKFLETSHGYRPKRSTKTAIAEIKKWSGTTWMIEGKISALYEGINHHILAKLIEKEIKDKNLMDLYWKLVKAGYVSEEGIQTINNLGVTQGGVIYPILSNIYLHEFDKFMHNLCTKYNEPNKRVDKHKPEYDKAKKDENIEWLKKKPSIIRNKTKGISIKYNRYADDWIVGVSGPREIAIKIKEEIKSFLNKELELVLNDEKTKIKHLTTEKAQYLGFEIGRRPKSYTESIISRTKTGISKICKLTRAKNSTTRIQIYAPISKLVDKLIMHGFATSKDKPCALTKWIYLEPKEIIKRYNAVTRGILNYYDMVENRNLLTHIIWILKFSATLTLARKWRLSPKKIFKKLGKNLTIEEKKNVVVEKKKKISFWTPTTLKRNSKQKDKDRQNAKAKKKKRINFTTYNKIF